MVPLPLLVSFRVRGLESHPPKLSKELDGLHLVSSWSLAKLGILEESARCCGSASVNEGAYRNITNHMDHNASPNSHIMQVNTF